jgi:peptide/nickel transport system substrate-binding protein
MNPMPASRPLANPSVEAARTALRATRYNNEPIVLMVASDLEAAKVSTEILADRMRRAGFNVDAQVTDWATLLARRGGATAGISMACMR